MDCENCGAPATPGLVACGYCDDPLPGMGPGEPCPNCGDRNVPSNPACVSCRTSLMKACVFCGLASPIATIHCIRCGESFVGAAERKAEREQAARNQQMIGLAAQGLSVLGTAAATPTGRGFVNQLFGEIMQDIGKPRKKW